MSIQSINNKFTKDIFGADVWNADSVPAVSNRITDNVVASEGVQSTFFGQSSIEILPVLRPNFASDWMGSYLLLAIVIIVLLWFLMPNRKALIHNWRHPFEKPGEGSNRKPGFVFSFVFYLNYLFVLVLFTLLSLNNFDYAMSTSISSINMFYYTLVVVAIYSFGKLVYISLAGVIFETQKAAQYQIQLYVNQANLIGLLFLSILLLIVFTGGTVFFYLGFIILLISNLIKWKQTITIGNILSQFKLYHLIIYLCTLELIPLLLLFKLIKF